MKKALMIVSILFVAVISTACINNIAVQELNNKASQYMQNGDYESAISRLQASIDLDSTMYQTYYNLGVAAINANRYELAVDSLNKGLKINPDFNDFYYSLGIAQIGYADQIMDESYITEEAKANADDGTVEIKRTITDDDKAKAVELRQEAINNLNKYLEKESVDVKDKELIDEMIKQSEEFINGEEKKEAASE